MALNIYNSANGWVSTLINSALEKIPYDKTIAATIIDDTNAENNKYIASYENARFEVYSQNTSFKNHDEVYILIPQGDFNEQKIIISKKF